MNIEPLESRIAPAATFTYTDVDGDLVTVHTTKGSLGSLLWAAGDLTDHQIQVFDFTIEDVWTGADITITAKPQDANGDGFIDGDGLVNIGQIKATNVSLGNVKVPGDLGSLDAENVKSLQVLSLGRFGTSTGAPSTTSTVVELGKLKVKSDMVGALVINVLKSATIGGSLDGSIFAFDNTDKIGPVKINGDLRGKLGANSAPIASVIVGGSIVAGSSDTGEIHTNGQLGPVKVGGDLRGSAPSSGQITGGKVVSVTIGGSLVPGTGGNTALITSQGIMGPVKIRGEIRGNADSGRIQSSKSIASVTVGGSLLGGAITAGEGIGPVAIGGSIEGGAGVGTGRIFAQGKIDSIKIGHDLIGGAGPTSGTIEGLFIPSVTIGGSVIGGAANRSGEIFSGSTILTLKIGGDLRGGDLLFGATAFDRSGYIEAGRLGSVTIGGSIIAGFDFSNSGTPTKNASIRSGSEIGSLTVRGSLLGSSGNDVVQVVITAQAQAGVNSSSATDLAIRKVSIGGDLNRASILAGYDASGTGTNADAQVGKVTVGGDWISSDLITGVASNGNGFGNANDSKISGGRDDALISKIGKVIIKGNAIGTISSSDTAVFAIEAEQIISIKVGGATELLQAGKSNDSFNLRDPLGATFQNGGISDFYAFEV